MEEIILTINKETGATTIETRGFQGSACLVAAKSFKDAVGGVIAGSERPTSEMFDEQVSEPVKERRQDRA
jgi:hypothetical protein